MESTLGNNRLSADTDSTCRNSLQYLWTLISSPQQMLSPGQLTY
ncbi:hypothetical protein BVRB_8g201540 [Beta vulgaris subsp. vulgaris]|uniref:Uncharacterized protein n=1 Tax=Beta vulgaris subsp. vulgaris TaxID=3555 RepID=A0A0J8B5T1_BETVV|nr:hypothetical protein BVRB_8g201540 [Beta vulgaris subsp. vulgaris]